MGSVVRVFDPMGKELGHLNVLTERAWTCHNWDEIEFGTCAFRISTLDTNFSESNIGFGNFLLVEDEDKQLPDWIGIIDSEPTRTWRYGEVSVNAVSVEKILDWRSTYLSALTGSSGYCFREAIRLANTTVPLGMEISYGRIAAGSNTMRIPTKGTIFEIVNRISKQSGGVGGDPWDWNITADVDRGQLFLEANLYEGSQGIVTNADLDDKNTEGVKESLIEQGEIWNYFFIYSEGATSGGRIIKFAFDGLSIARYGLRVKVEEGVGKSPEGLLWQAKNKVRQYKEPSLSFPTTVLDHQNVFKLMRIGNIFTWRSANVGFKNSRMGFQQTVKLKAFEYSDKDNKLNAILETYDE